MLYGHCPSEAFGFQLSAFGAPRRRAPPAGTAGALSGRTPFALEFARDGLGNSTLGPSRCLSVEVACNSQTVASALDTPLLTGVGSSPAALAHSRSNGVRPARRRAAPGWSAGRGRLEGGGPGAIETASREADCTRDSASDNAEIGIARLRIGAQSGERDAVSRVPLRIATTHRVVAIRGGHDRHSRWAPRDGAGSLRSNDANRDRQLADMTHRMFCTVDEASDHGRWQLRPPDAAKVAKCGDIDGLQLRNSRIDPFR